VTGATPPGLIQKQNILFLEETGGVAAKGGRDVRTGDREVMDWLMHRASGDGWPDLFLVRGVKALVAELKVGNNRCTREQERWLTDLEATGIEAQRWRPDAWEEIERTLA
jgi:hypothetical protein